MIPRTKGNILCSPNRALNDKILGVLNRWALKVETDLVVEILLSAADDRIRTTWQLANSHFVCRQFVHC